MSLVLQFNVLIDYFYVLFSLSYKSYYGLCNTLRTLLSKLKLISQNVSIYRNKKLSIYRIFSAYTESSLTSAIDLILRSSVVG
jgi:hypothetical protein